MQKKEDCYQEPARHQDFNTMFANLQAASIAALNDVEKQGPLKDSTILGKKQEVHEIHRRSVQRLDGLH